MRKRKFTSAFKTKVVLDALSERYTIQELARKHQLHATQISAWKGQFLKTLRVYSTIPLKTPRQKLSRRKNVT